MALQDIGTHHALCLDIFREGAVLRLQIFIVRQKIAVALYREQHKAIARRFQFRCDDILHRGDIDRKAHQSRRHIDLVKGTGHGVLAADRSESQLELCLIGTEQGREGLRPSLRLVVVHAAEELLEGQVNLVDIAARRSDFCDRVADRVDSAVIGTPAREIGIEAVAHNGCRIGFAAKQRNLCDHALGLGQLLLTAVGHGDGARADRGIEHLDQPLLRADIQIAEDLEPLRLDIAAACIVEGVLAPLRQFHFDFRRQVRTVRVEEGAGQVHNVLASPVQHEARLCRDHGNRRRFQVLFLRILQEGIHIFRIDYAGHALLRLGNGNFRAVETRIFQRHLVELDLQAGRKLADCDRDAACAEVVALLD